MPSEFIHWLPPRLVHPSMKTPMTGGTFPSAMSQSSRSGTFLVKGEVLSHCMPVPVKPWRKYTTG